MSVPSDFAFLPDLSWICVEFDETLSQYFDRRAFHSKRSSVRRDHLVVVTSSRAANGVTFAFATWSARRATTL